MRVSVHNEEGRKGLYEVTTALEPYQDEPLASSNDEEIKDDDADINGYIWRLLRQYLKKGNWCKLCGATLFGRN